ncbi:MAG: glycosyltransferase [Candidatus Moranbacteria bacterium]|nr:glycosyltransferase [Candidatus Moranbacteria bacterium]
MAAYSQNQIFSAKNRLRSRLVQVLLAVLAVFLVVMFGTMLFSMFSKAALPDPNLAMPASQLKSAAQTVADSTTGQNQASIVSATSKTAPSPSLLSNASLGENYRPKIIGYYVNWDDTSFTSLENNIDTLDELIPEWLHLADENGGIAIDNQSIQDNTLNFISHNKPGLSIEPLINNYDQNIEDWNPDMLDKMLNNPAARTQTIQNLYDFVKKNNFSGISIDFEAVPDQDQPLLAQFMNELYAKFHPDGLEVTQNIPLDDDSFNAAEFAKSNDFLILMAYDEHSVGSDPAGPIASQDWFVNALNVRLIQASAEKYIVALGNYGYDWDGSTFDGQPYTFQDAMLSANDSNSKVKLDAASLNPTYDYYDGDNLHHVWFLDATSTFNQISAIRNTPFHGYALWRMGSEDPSVWNVLKSPGNVSREAASPLRSMKYGYDINYEGSGEILKVTGMPQDGKRNLTYDQSKKMVVDEDIFQYPSAYTIYRWGGSDPKKIALTFDDGPDPLYTPQILSILKEHDVPATFFVVGVNGIQNQNILRQIVAEGSEIGSHTFTHPNVTEISNSQFAFELNSNESLLAGAIGRHTLLFRPPYAEDVEPVTPDEIRPVLFASEQGYYTVGMHIDPNDWSSPGVEKIVSQVVAGAESGEGNVVLLHDGGGDRSQTVAALPKIIEGLQGEGYEIVTVSDLAGISGDAAMPPVSSGSRMVSALSESAYAATGWGTGFLYFFFLAGILLGIGRFAFIAVLAAIQKIRRHFQKFPEYISNFHPKVAVVIPAYNEENVIRNTVESILASDYPNLEIILVNDGSTDNTLNVMEYFFGKNPKVGIYSQPNKGKWAALNSGIEKTEAPIIVTLDADTIFLPSTISRLVPHFSDPEVGAVAGNTKVGNRKNILTRWQALEYITSQNLDRRAFDMMNCITVVPGSVGAWQKKALIEAGGFSNWTLAEDADLTFSIIRQGYRVVYETRALAYTEAPATSRDFVKQRFRWMFGTLQTAWKHLDAFFHPKKGFLHSEHSFLGAFAIPNIFVFQVLFPLISPLMDLTILGSLVWASWQYFQHPVDYSAFFTLQKLLDYYLIFLFVDFVTSAAAFALEKDEDWKLLFWLIPQRFYYRQLMYYVAIKVFLTALTGKIVSWGKLKRKATVSYQVSQ